ncbi:TRAP transporter permease [Paenibacillus sedimenti]|uniref:TRAP transporter permease n=1 Tax=Paenibacillus sedimenti TaxID=2770274 RepID=A0A926KWL2_9BACL|nr:TRAP transporter permease [Paenibacillus sedimenti]MBD0383285.1 TRAP transporter permease [Paenibacillus sedimenti]
MSQEEIQEMIGKYDPDFAFRRLEGVMRAFTFAFAVLFSLYQLYVSFFTPFPDQVHRAVHLSFGLGLIFLLYPSTKKGRGSRIPWYDYVLAALGIGVGLYWLLNYEELFNRIGNFTVTDFIVGGLAMILVLIAALRVVGIPIVTIAAVFLLYAYFGNHMPGFLEHRGVSLERLISQMYFTSEGILGTPLMVSASFIFLFILFGSFLDKTGVGEYFNDLSLVVAGRRIGGPAKVTIFSSALQGTISGSSVANVVTSGAFTIPMMKRLGYRREFAGAVEASSSTGGQIMPPIMGAAAFLMAEFTNIPYSQVALAALIPALLFFTGIWIMVHFEAKRLGLRGLLPEELPRRKEVLQKLYLLIPILAIIGFLMSGMSPMRSAIYGILSVIVVGAVRKATRMSFKDILSALEDGARSALGVVAATACAGIIVGVITLTGIGLKFANGLLELAGGLLLPTLILTMLASLVLGMGTPTTANYIITSTIAAPAIIALDYPVPLLAAHMFVFYFGIVADITPPVALASFAASGIADSNPMKTGLESTRVAIAAFIIPFIFVYQPQLLLIDTTWAEAVGVTVTAVIGMIGVGAGMIGFWLRPLNAVERLIVIAAGLLLIIPGLVTDLIGMGTLGVMFSLQYVQGKRRKGSLN